MKQHCLFALLLTSLAAASIPKHEDDSTSDLAGMYNGLASNTRTTAPTDDTDVDSESPVDMYLHLSKTPSPLTSTTDSPSEGQDESDSPTAEPVFLNLDDEDMLLVWAASMPLETVAENINILFSNGNEELAKKLIDSFWKDETSTLQDSMESEDAASEARSQDGDRSGDPSIMQTNDIFEDEEETNHHLDTQQLVDAYVDMSHMEQEIAQDTIRIAKDALWDGDFELAGDLMNAIWEEEDDSALASHLCDDYTNGEMDLPVFEALNALRLDNDSLKDILAFYVQDLKGIIQREKSSGSGKLPVRLVTAIEDYVNALEWRMNPEPRLVLIIYVLETLGKESEEIEGIEYLFRLLHLTFYLNHRLSESQLD